MNDALPDRVVIAVILLTVILVFALAFALRPANDQERRFLWRESPPAEVAEPSSGGTLAI